MKREMTSEYSKFKFVMEDKLKEASKQRKISMKLKNFCHELLECGDTKFDLIYSSTRDSYKGVIFRENPKFKTLSFILSNYGEQLFFKVKKDKRI